MIRWAIRRADGAWLKEFGGHYMWVTDRTVDAVHAGWTSRTPQAGWLLDGEELAVRIDGAGQRRGTAVTTGAMLAAVAHALGVWPGGSA